MKQQLTRRQFLRADVTGKQNVIRPPWSRVESEFIHRCTRCNACIEACAEKIIHSGDGGFPRITFSKGECTFCGECARACNEQAFDLSMAQPWSLAAEISTACLAYLGVVCMICKEQCEVEAIHFDFRKGGVSTPRLDNSICNGCGACYQPCPAKAISFSYRPDELTPGGVQLKEAQ